MVTRTSILIIRGIFMIGNCLWTEIIDHIIHSWQHAMGVAHAH